MSAIPYRPVWNLGEEECHYPLQAISFLATFALYETEDLPPQKLVASNRAVLQDDVKCMYDAVEIDESLGERYAMVIDQYERIIMHCCDFRHKIDNLFVSLPEHQRKMELKPADAPHPSLYAVAYLVVYESRPVNSYPKPNDDAVDHMAAKMLEDMTKIADQAGRCDNMRTLYTDLQNSFDDILSMTVDFRQSVDDFRDDVPSLV